MRDIGAVGEFEMLSAEQAVLDAETAVTEARAQRYADTTALFQALGGGWWNKDQKVK
jgi:outer membrane protein TolC